MLDLQEASTRPWEKSSWALRILTPTQGFMNIWRSFFAISNHIQPIFPSPVDPTMALSPKNGWDVAMLDQRWPKMPWQRYATIDRLTRWLRNTPAQKKVKFFCGHSYHLHCINRWSQPWWNLMNWVAVVAWSTSSFHMFSSHPVFFFVRLHVAKRIFTCHDVDHNREVDSWVH